MLTVRTDAQGVAMVMATANAVAGCYSVLAASTGTTDIPEFVLRNVNPAPNIFADGFEVLPASPAGVPVCRPE